MTVPTLKSFFRFHENGTTVSREVIAGLTTFTTMSYIVVVNPVILAQAGIPAGPSFVATVLAAVFGCVAHGIVCQSSVRHCALHGRKRVHRIYRLRRARIQMANCPRRRVHCRSAVYRDDCFARPAVDCGSRAGILTLQLCRRHWIVSYFHRTESGGNCCAGCCRRARSSGHITSAPVLVAIAGFILIAILVIRKVPGAILLGILITAVIAFLTKTAPTPDHVMGLPPSISSRGVG
jgi:adenine/guanine/hypoxanthine permease